MVKRTEQQDLPSFYVAQPLLALFGLGFAVYFAWDYLAQCSWLLLIIAGTIVFLIIEFMVRVSKERPTNF